MLRLDKGVDLGPVGLGRLCFDDAGGLALSDTAELFCQAPLNRTWYIFLVQAVMSLMIERWRCPEPSGGFVHDCWTLFAEKTPRGY